MNDYTAYRQQVIRITNGRNNERLNRIIRTLYLREFTVRQAAREVLIGTTDPDNY